VPANSNPAVLASPAAVGDVLVGFQLAPATPMQPVADFDQLEAHQHVAYGRGRGQHGRVAIRRHLADDGLVALVGREAQTQRAIAPRDVELAAPRRLHLGRSLSL
jgi:hypothetical protein